MGIFILILETSYAVHQCYYAV